MRPCAAGSSGPCEVDENERPDRYPLPVPRYEFRCRQCSTTFEVDRPMAAAGDPAPCPAGHADTVKLLSTVSLGGRSGSGGRAPVAAPAGGGGCCGGGCCG